MPVNKNVQLRYQILDRCFSNFGRKLSFEELLEEVNDKLYYLNSTHISVRQLRMDIENMKDSPFFAPIEAYPYYGKKCYYRYSDPNFSIFKNELSPEELTNLRSTIEMLGRYRGIPSNAWLEEVISNLEFRFGVRSNNANIIEFEQNEQLKGLEFLSELIEATQTQQPLSIQYRTFKGKDVDSIVHPYFLKQYNNRWFLFGLERNDRYGDKIANKALDRIVSITPAKDTKFIPCQKGDFREHFKDIVGVTIPEDHPTPEKVILKFDQNRFPYVVSKPIHRTQEILDMNERTISITVRPNKELEAQILSYGNQAEVIGPEWLRRQISEKIKENFRIYFPVQNDCTDGL